MSISTEGMPNPQFEFGDRIRKVRRSIAGLSQAEMAGALGVTQKAYAAWESGGRPSDIVAIARRVEELWPGRVTAAWVIGVDDNPPRPPSHPSVAPQVSGVPITQKLHRGRRPTPVSDRLALVRTDSELTADAVAYINLSENPSESLPLPRMDSNHQPSDPRLAA